MLRIGGGLSGVDLTAQFQLQRSFAELAQSSEKLSTLKRINHGSDDPSGLIALEALKAELVSLEEASSSADRARSLVRVADSALSQTGNLFNQIRGNILEASSSTTSPAQREALQIEIDAALEALDRIGSSTSLGGRKLLDGSAGFQVSGVNDEQITDIQVHQRSGGSSTSIDVEVTQAAVSAELTVSKSGPLTEDVTLLVSGNEGSVTLEFSDGATLDDVATAVNSTSSDSGVTAEVVDGDLVLSSSEVGSSQYVEVEVLEGSLDVGDGRATGGDVVAVVNGTETTGDGNTLSVHTDSIEADITIAADFEGQADAITVSGSALTFLVGPDPTDTARLALPQVNGATLGGAVGRLNELRSGGSASLSSGNYAQAIEILDGAQSRVLNARARAGAFERYSIDATQAVLNESIVNISSAISQIGDTDVALESAKLVRSLILVDSGINSVRLTGSRANAARSLLGGAFSAFA